MRNIKTYFIRCIFFILLSIFMISCNEDPTNIAMRFLQDTVTVVYMSDEEGSILSCDSNYIIERATNNTGAVLIGCTDKIKAATVLRFDFPPEHGWINEDDIISSELLLFPLHYAIGDTNGSNYLSFDIKKVINRWTFEDTKADDILNSDMLYDNHILASWSGNIKYKDTVNKDSLDTIAINIPKSLCVEWFKKRNVMPTDSTPDSEITWGIALIPKNDCSVINSFKAAGNVYPTGSIMRVVYKKMLNNGLDTNITLEVPAGISTKFVILDEVLNNKDLIIQSGVKVHTRLNFDISSIPNLASTNLAELTLTMDTSRSYWGNEGVDTVFRLGLFTDLSYEFNNAEPALVCYGRRKEGTNQYIFRSAEIMLMYLLNSQEGKGSLVLMPNSSINDANTLNRYVFYGNDEKDESLRPKLKLIYSYLEQSK